MKTASFHLLVLNQGQKKELFQADHSVKAWFKDGGCIDGNKVCFVLDKNNECAMSKCQARPQKYGLCLNFG